MRLTIRNSDGTVSQPMNLDWPAALEKLAAYEDAEEQGLLVPVRHGRWLIKTVRGDKRTVCSECLIETGTCYEDNYCPNCGARMDLKES